MTTFTSLLAQTEVDHSTAPETLADTLRIHAKDLTDADLTVLVAGLREQRSRWNTAQAQGSKERITSKKVATKRAPKKNAAVVMTSGFAIKKPTL